MKPLTIAVRANGGSRIGLGHIRRCLSLAQALTRQGARVQFISNSDETTSELIQQNGFSVSSIDPVDDFDQTCNAITRMGAEALLVDSYEIGADYLRRMSEYVDLLIVIDDIADRRLPVDVVINSNIYGKDLAYDSPSSTTMLLGASYAILRPEFANQFVREFPEKARHVLLTVGGSDWTGLTFRLIESILDAHDDLLLTVIVGPFFKGRDKILQLATTKPDQVRVRENPGDIRSLMLEADLAVTGGGQTTYELAATGTPSLALAISEHQLLNIQALAESGTLVYAGHADDPQLEQKLMPEFDRLLRDSRARRLMSERGRALIDGHGADRLAAAIISECAERKSRASVLTVQN